MESSAALPADAVALGVSFDGRAYHYGQYSYDRLADAINYAKLERSRPGFRQAPVPNQWPQWEGPTPADQQQMAAHGVVYEDGHYRYGPYRYDQLAAALEYARHCAMRSHQRDQDEGRERRTKGDATGS